MKHYFKSFVILENTPVTTTYISETDSRKVCQTLQDILGTGVVQPNTVHAQIPTRLCVSQINEGFPGTYRPEGIVFATDVEPDYFVPFDLMKLTREEQTPAYFHRFLGGYKQFIFTTMEELLAAYANSEEAITDLNAFRREHGLNPVDRESMNYNECCFENNVPMELLALIGQSNSFVELAKKYSVPFYKTVEEYLKGRKEE